MELKAPQKQQREIPREMIDGRDRHVLAERTQPQLLPGSAQRLEEARTPPDPKELVTESDMKALPPDLIQLLADVRALPSPKELVAEFAFEDINEKQFLDFFRCGLLEAVEVYELVAEANIEFVIALMAADLILSGENTQAVYMMFFYGLVNEVRGMRVQFTYLRRR
jgi:hypothetical protein